jgi:hypothetical protein
MVEPWRWRSRGPLSSPLRDGLLYHLRAPNAAQLLSVARRWPCMRSSAASYSITAATFFIAAATSVVHAGRVPLPAPHSEACATGSKICGSPRHGGSTPRLPAEVLIRRGEATAGADAKGEWVAAGGLVTVFSSLLVSKRDFAYTGAVLCWR